MCGWAWWLLWKCSTGEHAFVKDEINSSWSSSRNVTDLSWRRHRFILFFFSSSLLPLVFVKPLLEYNRNNKDCDISYLLFCSHGQWLRCDCEALSVIVTMTSSIKCISLLCGGAACGLQRLMFLHVSLTGTVFVKIIKNLHLIISNQASIWHIFSSML